MNLVMKDGPGTILNELQRASKFHRLVKLSFADGSRLRIVKRDNSIRYRLLPSKLLLGLLQKGLRQINLLAKALAKLSRLLPPRSKQGLKDFAALLEAIGGELRNFGKNFPSLLLALFGLSLGRLAPTKQRRFVARTWLRILRPKPTAVRVRVFTA